MRTDRLPALLQSPCLWMLMSSLTAPIPMMLRCTSSSRRNWRTTTGVPSRFIPWLPEYVLWVRTSVLLWEKPNASAPYEDAGCIFLLLLLRTTKIWNVEKKVFLSLVWRHYISLYILMKHCVVLNRQGIWANFASQFKALLVANLVSEIQVNWVKGSCGGTVYNCENEEVSW